MATCNDCLHYEACKKFNEIRTNVIEESKRGAENLCELYADKSRFVELPCKVGDVVYFLPYAKLYNATLISIEINYYTTPQIWLTIEYDSEFSAQNTYKSRIDLILGKSLFLTKAEAEAALVERTKDDPN